MSLKAKVEAVVYAAEEPVTLAQLAVTFAPEILEALAESSGNVRADEPEAAEGAAESPADGATDPAPETAEGGLFAGAGEKKAARQRDRDVRAALERVLGELISEYAEEDRGIEIRQIAGGYRMSTKPEYHDAVRGFVKSLTPPMKLSLPALETLAVIAYKQPVTAPEVSEIRGVDAGGVLASLISRKLITTAGRKQVIGRPILYKTTKEFLLRFGLKDLSELPSMQEFEKMAGELADGEAEAENAAMPPGNLSLAPDAAANAPESSPVAGFAADEPASEE